MKLRIVKILNESCKTILALLIVTSKGRKYLKPFDELNVDAIHGGNDSIVMALWGYDEYLTEDINWEWDAARFLHPTQLTALNDFVSTY